MTAPTEHIEYVGDAVYAKFDGFGIELRANDPKFPTDTIYIEPQVLQNLVEFHERVYWAKKAEADG